MSRRKNYDYGYLSPRRLYPYTDKERALYDYEMYTLDKTLRLFKYNNLPESIPQRELELILQTNGHAVFAHYDGQLWAFRSSLGGMPGPYYFPTEAIICNPWLRYEAVLKLDEECVCVFNDTTLRGVLPMIDRYATHLVENDITQHLANINMRLAYLIKCYDDNDKLAADKFIKDLIDGKLSSLQSDGFFGSLESLPYAGSGQGNQVTQLIEYSQWLKTSLLHEFGIETENGNVKREYVNESEVESNGGDMLLVDDMLKCRKEGLEKVNNMFGTDITVELAATYLEQREPDPVEEDEPLQLPEGEVESSEPETEEPAAETEPETPAESDTETETETETEEPESSEAAEAVAEAVEELVEEIVEETLEEADNNEN